MNIAQAKNADSGRRHKADRRRGGQYPDHGTDLKTVIERVDQAMYRSKLARGRGGILQVGQAAPA